MPNDVAAGSELPFAVRAVDSGGQAVVRNLQLVAQTPRKVYEGVITAVTPGDAMLAPDGDRSGPVFLLDGTTLSVFPQSDSSLHRLEGVYLYAGGDTATGGDLVVNPSFLTAPEITSYESAILLYPLELEIGSVLAVGSGCAVDLVGSGLLGNTTADSVALPGEVAAERLAGGSHGGDGSEPPPATGSRPT